MSLHYAQAIIEDERDAVALTWDKRQPEALYQQAIALRSDDPDTVAALLAQANAQIHGGCASVFYRGQGRSYPG